MFDEYFGKYRMENVEKTPRRRVKDGERRLMSLIGEAPVPRRKLSRAAVTAIACAATAACLTVTVGAVTQWDLSRLLSSWFGSDDKLSSVISDVDVTVVRNTYENLDFTVNGALRCDDLNIVFFDVTRTDGKSFDMTGYEFTNYYNVRDGELVVNSDGSLGETVSTEPFLGFDPAAITHKKALIHDNVYSNKDVDYVQCFFVEDDDPTDNKVTVGISWTDDDTSGGNELELTLLNMNVYEYHYQKNSSGYYSLVKKMRHQFQGVYSADIRLDDVRSDCRSIIPDDEQKNSTGLERVTVYPMAVDIKTDPYKFASMYHTSGYVTLKDGSMIEFGENRTDLPLWFSNVKGLNPFINKYDLSAVAHGVENIKCDTKYILDKAVDITDVVSVTVNGIEVPFGK